MGRPEPTPQLELPIEPPAEQEDGPFIPASQIAPLLTHGDYIEAWSELRPTDGRGRLNFAASMEDPLIEMCIRNFAVARKRRRLKQKQGGIT